MSRKIPQPSRSPLLMAGRTSAIDFATNPDRKKHESAPKRKVNQHHSHQKTVAQPGASVDSDSSTSDSPTGEDADGTSSENAEADNEGGNDGDPDVQAPSEKQFDPGEGQAGHIHDSKKPMSGNEEDSYSNDTSKSSPPDSLGAPLKTRAPTPLLKDDINSDDHDDDDYTGVDLISESGDEGLAVEHHEEKAIIDSEEGNIGLSLPPSPPNSPSFSISSADFVNPDLGLSPWFADDPFFAEQINLLHPHSFANETDYYGHNHGQDLVMPFEDVPRRRVRFAEPLMLPSETEETASLQPDDATVPLLQSSSIKSTKDDPQPAKMVSDATESNPEGHATSDRSGTGPGYQTPFERFDSADNDDVASSVGSSSGYETDEGETTDEEDVPAFATTRPSALLRHASSNHLNDRLASRSLPKTSSTRSSFQRRRGPTLGSWVADPTKPMALIASSGKELIVYPAQRPASKGGKVFPTISSNGHTSAQPSPHVLAPQLAAPSGLTATEESDVERSELSSQGGAATPMLSTSSNLMMSGLNVRCGNLLSGHALGPPEAFFPFHSIGTDGRVVLDSLDVDEDDDDDDDGEGLLNIEDFINFGEDSEDSDHDDGSSTESPKVAKSDQTDAEVTPTVSPSARSASRSLFDHLDKGKVTAFRRNQYNPDTSLYRASSSSSSSQVPSPIKSNGFVAASAFSPLKKRKLSSDFDPSLPNNAAFAKRRMVSPH